MPTVNVPLDMVMGFNQFIRMYPAGTTFRFQEGVYRIGGILPRSGDIFTGTMKGSKLVSILSGATILGNWVFDGRRWWASITISEPVIDVGPETCSVTSPMCNYPEDLFIDNNLIKRVGTIDEVTIGTWYLDYDNNKICLGQNPWGYVVEISVLPNVFGSSNSASNVRIEYLVIEKYASPTQKSAVPLANSALGGENWELRRCEIKYCHSAGVGLDTKTIMRECYLHHNGQFGYIAAGLNILIEGNEICWNNTNGYNPYWGAGGCKAVYTTDMIVRGNYVHHNSGPGLWTDINNIGTLYEFNTCKWNSLTGIFHEISYAATIRGNTCSYNGISREYPWWVSGAGICVVSSPDVEVYENICVENWQGITGLNDDRGVGIHGPWVLQNLHVYNNMVRSVDQPNGSGRIGVTGDGFSARFENNHYVLSSRPDYEPFFWANANLKETGWKATGQDLTGTFEYK